MKFSMPTTRAGKGQLRCFECRQTFPIKEGAWHHRGTQQVFLCKSCEKALQVSPEKFSDLIKE